MDFENLIQRTNAYMLSKDKLKFFGILSYGIEKLLDESGDNGVLGGYTDGRTITYIKSSNQEENTREFIAFVTAHELMHIQSGHIKRLGDRDLNIWNVATDHVINRELMQLESVTGLLTIPAGIVFLKDIHARDPVISAEALYAELTGQNKPPEPPPPDEKEDQPPDDEKDDSSDNQSNNNDDTQDKPSDPNGTGGETKENNPQDESGNEQQSNNTDGSDSNGSGDDGSPSNESTSDSNSGNESTTTSTGHNITKVGETENGKPIYEVTGPNGESYGSFVPDTNIPPGEPEIEKAIEDIKHKSIDVWNTMPEVRGSMPGNFKTYFDEIFKIEIPWVEVLESAILYPVQCQRRRTWSERNMYIRKVRVPGKVRKEPQANIAVIGIDCSGSITNSDLKTFLGVCISAIEHMQEIVIYVHDTMIQQEFRYISGKVTIDQIAQDIGSIYGRGGTSHKDIFNKIEQLNETEKISVIIFLTDLWSDVESIYEQYQFITEHETIWITPKVSVNEGWSLPNAKTKRIIIN